jgi:putative FmdB family regulatory protein
MTLYSYRCDSCRRLFNTEHRGDSTICPDCGGPSVRKFSFTTSNSMREHWNTAVGQYVSSRSDMTEALKRQSEEASIRTGIDHQFEMVERADMADPTAHGVDESTIAR